MRDDDRIDVWLLIVVPVVLFWALVLFAPRSYHLGWGERFAVGATVTALWVPLMWARIRKLKWRRDGSPVNR